MTAIPQEGPEARPPTTQSTTVTCPHCRHARLEPMPLDRCIFFYECVGCRVVLRPKPGDCCVFCSYGDRPCPPKRSGESCC